MKQKIAIVLSLAFLLSSCAKDTFEVKEISEEHPLSYHVEYIEDPTLTTTEEVLVEGEDGVEEIIHTIKYKNGMEMSREKTSTKVLKKPINKVIAIKP